MKGVALFLALYMFVGSLFPQTDFGQLAKLGNVWEHYRQHLSDNELGEEQFTFTDFIKVHFITPDEHCRTPGHEHEGLPFHSINTSQNYTVYSFSKLYLSALIPAEVERRFFYTHSLPGDFVANVFHPPATA